MSPQLLERVLSLFSGLPSQGTAYIPSVHHRLSRLHQGSLRHQLQLLLHKEDFAWDAVWKGLAALRNSQQPQGAVALTRQRGWKQLDKGRPEAGESSLAPQRLRELSGILLRL